MLVGGVVLAAGCSARMGKDKLLLPYRGRPLLVHALQSMADSTASPVFCVVGCRADEILPVVRTHLIRAEIRYLVNPDYASGRASSVRLGLASMPDECEAAVFLPGDMPLIRAADVGALIRRFESTGSPIVVAVDEAGERAHPVLFARQLFPRLAALEGDESGQGIIRELWDVAEKVPIARSRVLDVDTEEDYRRLLANERGEHARVL